jgi:hypothetical protein
MTGYLARLTLRALGRPVSAGAMPRAATVPVFLRDSGTDEAASVEGDSASPLPERREREPAAEAVRTRAPAAAIVPRAAIRTADPGENLREDSAAASASQAHRASTSPLVALSPVEREAGPLTVISPSASTRVDAAARGRRKPAATATPERSTPSNSVAALETQAQPISRHVQRARRPGDTEAPHSDGTASALGARDDAARPTIDVAHQKPLATDTLRSGHPLKPPLASPRAGTDGEPPSVTVEIGRIEVKLAPAPATASRVRAGADGFDRYWRMRNYLERLR